MNDIFNFTAGTKPKVSMFTNDIRGWGGGVSDRQKANYVICE